MTPVHLSITWVSTAFAKHVVSTPTKIKVAKVAPLISVIKMRILPRMESATDAPNTHIRMKQEKHARLINVVLHRNWQRAGNAKNALSLLIKMKLRKVVWLINVWRGKYLGKMEHVRHVQNILIQILKGNNAYLTNVGKHIILKKMDFVRHVLHIHIKIQQVKPVLLTSAQPFKLSNPQASAKIAQITLTQTNKTVYVSQTLAAIDKFFFLEELVQLAKITLFQMAKIVSSNNAIQTKFLSPPENAKIAINSFTLRAKFAFKTNA